MQFYYDDEMTDRAVQAYFSDCEKNGVVEGKPTKLATTREGNEIILAGDSGEVARYHVVTDSGKESVRRVLT